MTQKPPNTSFSATTPSLQFAWDSTSLGALKSCPRYYQYNIVEGWEPRSISFHLTFGILYHKALEIYDHKTFEGMTHEEALHFVVRFVLSSTWINNKPWFSGDNNKNRFTLLRSVVWYLEQFQNDGLKTVKLANGKPAVELSFRFETHFKNSSGEAFWLCGHLDRIVQSNEDLYISDRKTTSFTLGERFFSNFTPDNQMTLYALGARIAYSVPVQGIIIDGAQIGVEFSRFERQPIARSAQYLDEWYNELAFWFSQAESFAKRNYWPQNDKFCSMYGGCRYRKICSLSPSSRESWLKADFTQRTWDPLQTRGDI